MFRAGKNTDKFLLDQIGSAILLGYKALSIPPPFLSPLPARSSHQKIETTSRYLERRSPQFLQ